MASISYIPYGGHAKEIYARKSTNQALQKILAGSKKSVMVVSYYAKHEKGLHNLFMTYRLLYNCISDKILVDPRRQERRL